MFQTSLRKAGIISACKKRRYPGRDSLNQLTPVPRGRDIRLDPSPACVIFDLDDTLCDHHRSREVRVDYAFQPFIPDITQRRAAVDEAIAIDLFGTDHFAEVLERYNVASQPAIDEVIERYLSDRFRGLLLHDDSVWGLNIIAESVPIGLITNGPTNIQQPKIDMLEIEHHFDFVVISESVGYWKPDPRIFEIGLEKAGLTAGDVIYVGDNPEADIGGAQAAGIRAVWMNRASIAWPREELPDLEVRDMRELVMALGLKDRD